MNQGSPSKHTLTSPLPTWAPKLMSQGTGGKGPKAAPTGEQGGQGGAQRGSQYSLQWGPGVEAPLEALV